MFNIANFLERFRGLAEKACLPRRAVIKALALQGIAVEEREVVLRDGVAYVRAHPAVKNLIYMKKALILESLKTGTAPVRDIR